MFSDKTPSFSEQASNKNYDTAQEPQITETISMVLLTQYTHPTKKWLLSVHFEEQINLWEVNLAPS